MAAMYPSWCRFRSGGFYPSPLFVNYELPTPPADSANDPIYEAFHSVSPPELEYDNMSLASCSSFDTCSSFFPSIFDDGFSAQNHYAPGYSQTSTPPLNTHLPLPSFSLPPPPPILLPPEILGLTSSDCDWLLQNPVRPSNLLSNLPAAEYPDPQCALCLPDLDIIHATFLCGFHFCYMAGARTYADLHILSGMLIVDPYTGGIRCGEPFCVVTTLYRAQLLVRSIAEEGEEAAAATAGHFGAVGDGRPEPEAKVEE
ncbi:hypothetical protein K445DRAFT_369945 [Daldinia sp. EC12]|nr:hypothetical protein F4774DRAFT_202148 [Daldinia eschscholtzii]OTB11936.1 hypothetical protein K445DRAFT_369945 [Daldinia sp. EC12]